ncbi:MAG: GxxExxY protein [Candidatus Sungbacteria bacterium]|nr:GxxExxY protein [Candidatus Sungbacteria bacterium]
MNFSKPQLIHPEFSYQLNGILFAVHNERGRYCNEKQYGDAIEKYLKTYHLIYEREKVLPPSFAGEVAGRNKIDFVVDDKILLELKTKRVLDRQDYYQTRRYLAALGIKLGILVNFRDKFLRPRRVLNSNI